LHLLPGDAVGVEGQKVDREELTRTPKEKRMAVRAVYRRSRVCSGGGGNRDRAEPLAPKPSKATLTAIKAKWYHWARENTRVRVISKLRPAVDRRNSPR